jgi:hypothetical protein
VRKQLARGLGILKVAKTRWRHAGCVGTALQKVPLERQGPSIFEGIPTTRLGNGNADDFSLRLYVRVPGRRKVRMKGPFGTDEFIAAAQFALYRPAPSPTTTNGPHSAGWAFSGSVLSFRRRYYRPKALPNLH